MKFGPDIERHDGCLKAMAHQVTPRLNTRLKSEFIKLRLGNHAQIKRSLQGDPLAIFWLVHAWIEA